MNLARLAQEAAQKKSPIKVGLIGAGKFGSMFLSQVHTIKGLEVAAISDLTFGRMQLACRSVAWHDAQIDVILYEADGVALAARDKIDVVVEATGNPRAGIIYAEAAIAADKHVVMVNVEADTMIGPLLIKKLML